MLKALNPFAVHLAFELTDFGAVLSELVKGGTRVNTRVDIVGDFGQFVLRAQPCIRPNALEKERNGQHRPEHQRIHERSAFAKKFNHLLYPSLS